MFPSRNKLAGTRKEVASYMVHINSLIKNLTPFEDDAEIRWVNFLMHSICKEPAEHTFIKVASLKIDSYFEVFKQLKNHVLSYLTGAT